MKKAILAISLCALILSLVVVAGCGDKTTIQTPQGSAQIEENGGESGGGSETGETGGGGTITINEGGESATLEQSQKPPTEAELGAPIYPGSEYDAENSGTANVNNQQGSAVATTARFFTGDSVSKVVDWYRGKLGEPLPSTSEGAQWLIGAMATGNYTIVQVEKGNGKTKISINHMAASIK